MSTRNQKRRQFARNRQRRGLVANLFDSLFSSGESWAAARMRGERWLRHEQLEDRRLLVVQAFSTAPLVEPGTGYDGVVAIGPAGSSTSTTIDSFCSGSLLSTGRHVLTAAHCVDSNGDGTVDLASADVVFEMANQHYVIPVGTSVRPVTIGPGYDGNINNGADLAIIELPVIAPFPAERYLIHRGSAELNDLGTFLGYGRTGTGTGGQIIGSGDIKRIGENEIGRIRNLANGDVLDIDFDDGTGGNNTLGDSLGLGNSESAAAQGDSGGPLFLNGREIAGIVSGGPTPNNFGAVSFFTRVSDFTAFIDGVLDDAAAITLDMNFQPAGNDGVPDNITLRRNAAGTRIEFLLGQQEVWSAPVAQVTSLTVIGSGDDDILTVDYANGNPVVGSLVFNGGSPSASDTFEILGTTAANTFNVTIIDANSADVTVSGGAKIDVDNVELLRINGVHAQVGPSDTLNYKGIFEGNNRIVFTPGNAPDSGTITGFDFFGGGPSHLPLEFLELGSEGVIDIDSNSVFQQNALVVRGSDGNDGVTVTGADGDIRLTTLNAGPHKRITTTRIETLVIETLDGDDVVSIGGEVNAYDTIDVSGGNPSGGSDVLFLTGAAATVETVTIRPDTANPTEQDVTGLGAAIDVSGVELIRYTGAGGDDTLTVNTGSGDDTARVRGGNVRDVVTSDRLPQIEFSGVLTFTLDLFAGLDQGTFVTGNLRGATNYQFSCSFGDTIIIEGNNGGVGGSPDDSFTITNPAGAVELAITDNNRGVTVSSVAADLPGHLIVHTLGGNDTVTVDVNGTPLVGSGNLLDIFYDGGTGTDLLQVTGTPTVTVTSVTYSVGPKVDEGRLVYDAAASSDMFIGFANLEPVIDLVPSATLIINGTNADNAINYRVGRNNADTADDTTRGRVSVDGFETIDFSNKTTLVLNGLAGSDTINLNNPNTPTGLTGITVNGGDPTGSDNLVVNGVAATVTVTLDTATITGASGAGGVVPIAFNGFEHLHVTAGASTTLSLANTSGSNAIDYIYTPGTAVDTGTIQNSVVPVSFSGYGAGATLDFNGDNSDGNDTLVLNGTAGNDRFTVAGTTGTVTLMTSGLSRATITQNEIEYLTLEGLDGDDRFDVAGGHPFLDINVHGGSPSASDVLFLTGAAATVETVTIQPDSANPTEQDVTGLGGTINVSGVEVIRYTGAGGDDTLVVDLGPDDSTALVSRGNGVDQVTSSVLPRVEFTGLDAFQIDSSDGSDQVTFKTHDLGGANPANYRLVSGSATTLIIEGEDGATSGAADDYTVTNPLGAALVAVKDNHGTGVTVTAGTTGFLGRVQLNTLGRDDTVTVDVGVGDGTVDVPITYDGGAGSDVLVVTGTPAVAVGAVTYSVGPQTGEGRLLYQDLAGATAMTIDFLNLEPIIDAVVAASLTVNATNADNAINYTPGLLNAAAHGLVSVDAFETIEFTNKGQLNLNGLAGSDVVSLNNPNTPTSLTQINVRGGDPTGSDKLVVNGVAATVTVTLDTATITGASGAGGAVPIAFNGFEHLHVTAGASTTLSLANTSALNPIDYIYTPGTAVDTGTIQNSVVPVSFSGYGAGATLDFNGDNSDGNDTLVLNGTAGNDRFTVAGTTGTVTLVTSGLSRATITQNEIEYLTLEGLDGDDRFDVAGDHPYLDANVHGGNPSASDVLNFTSSGGITTLDFGVQSVTEAGFSPVNYTSVEIINLNAGAQQVNFVDTAGDDDLTLTALTTNSGVVQANGVAPVVNYSNTSGNAANFNFLASGGEDTLIVRGNALAQRFDINLSGAAVADPLFTPPAGAVNAYTVRVNDGSNASIDGTVTYNGTTGDLESLAVYGLEGNDTFNVVSGAIPLFIDGGDPIGTSPGDLINIIAQGNPVVFEAGPESDEGGFIVDANARISFDHIEALGAFNASCAIVIGTHADDDITVIARTAQAVPPAFVGADGIRDFTTAVNAGPQILWIDVATLYVDGLAGDDDITVRAPAPNLADWDVDVYVAGGPPSAPQNGDRLVFETPGANSVVYTPTSSETGTLLLDENANGINDGTDSLITMGPFSVDCDGDGIVEYVSSPGGIEQLVYDGESTAGVTDLLTVVGTTGDDTIVHMPGAGIDEGTVRVNNYLALSYQNVGAAATVTVNGNTGTDTLVVDGKGTNDTFNVAGTTGAVDLRTTLGSHIDLLQQVAGANTVEHLVLNGLTGDDTFNLSYNLPYTTTTVNGGEPSASDVLNLTDAAAHAGTFVVNLAPQTITGFGGTVGFAGVEHVNLNGVDDTDTLTVNGTAEDDKITYTPTGAQAGTFQLQNTNTEFKFAAIAGTFTINGDNESGDEVVVLGTNNHDFIDVDSPNRTVTVENAAGTVLKPVVLGATVEVVTVQSRLGNDTILVIPAPATAFGTGGAPIGTLVPINLLVNVDGGGPTASDALVIAQAGGAALPATDFVVINKSRTPDTGVVRVFRSAVAMPDIFYENVEIVSPLLPAPVNPAQDPNLLILGPDNYEQNEFLSTAAYLGSGEAVNVSNLAIFPNVLEHRFVPADKDWFRVVAKQTGTLDFQVYFRVFPTNLLPAGGDISIEVFDVTGDLVASFAPNNLFGNNDADADERIRIPAVQGQTYYLRVVGANGDVVNGYNLTVTNEAPPTPYDLELQDTPVGDPPPANSDTGRSQFDNHTRDNTPTIFFRLDDAIFLHDLPGNDTNDSPPDEVIPIPFRGPGQTNLPGYAVAVFDEGNTPGQPAVQPQTPLGFATLVAGQEGVYQFTTPVLSNGSHFLTARVMMIDPANPTQTGWGPRSDSLEIVVDTIPPPVFFGTAAIGGDGLHPDSDTGVEDQPGTFVDRITSDTTPTLWGIAEANSIVRVYLDVNNDGDVNAGDILLGKTVALPTDGTNQFPEGQWELTSTIDMNDPLVLNALHASGVLPAGEIDGLRPLLVTAEDLAGNVSSDIDAERLSIFMDTRGPQVDGVFVTNERDYDLFDPKPSTDGPTPLVHAIDIDFVDRPQRLGQPIIIGTDAVFVIDVSGSTSSSFGGTPVGDLNGDGSPDTILDAEIAGFIAINNDLINRGLGAISQISIVAFASSAVQLDMDPVAPGVQLATTPAADADANGITDVEDALRTLSDLGGTNFEAGLQRAIDTVTALGNAAGNNVVFMSDGFPNSSGAHADEVATLNGMGVNQRAFGVGTGASLTELQIIDPAAVIFTSTDELLGFLGGGGGGGGGADSFFYPAVNQIVATTPGNYLLVGDANGVIPIQSIEFIDNTVPNDYGRTTIRLHFFSPLPDDRYTLTVYDTIVDDAGNALDGQDNTIEPQENPLFPSGDGVPGMDFVARFTVDTRPEIGTWAAGSVWVDTNGNFRFDPDNVDHTNRDLNYTLGFATDDVFAGKFEIKVNNPNTPDDERLHRFDTLAAYGNVHGKFRWLIDTDNDGVPNIDHIDTKQINGLPVAGNFDGNLLNGDEVGVFTGSVWWLDTNHDFNVDKPIHSAIAGYPIVGDFDGDGKDDLATWADDTFRFDLAANGFGQQDAAFYAGFIGVRERPVAADMNMDGYEDVGLWVADRSGGQPGQFGSWYFLISGTVKNNNQMKPPGAAVPPATLGPSILQRIVIDPGLGVPVVNFTPTPFGNDFLATYGDDFALPVVGNFDPPVTKSGATEPDWARYDVNGDGKANLQDAVAVVRDVKNAGSTPAAASSTPSRADVTRDGKVDLRDIVAVLRYLKTGAAAEGEAGPTADATSQSALTAISVEDTLTLRQLREAARSRESSLDAYFALYAKKKDSVVDLRFDDTLGDMLD